MFSVPKNIYSYFLFCFVQNVVEGVVHREGAEFPAARQLEEEDFNGAVLGAQVEGSQEAGGPAVDLEVVAVVVVEVVEVEVDLEVDLAVVEDVEVSEGRSSAGTVRNFPVTLSFYIFFPILLDMEKHQK
jgi:hypothetical protein